MTTQTVRTEWKQYLFDEGKDYTLNEAIQKVTDAVMFLKSKNMRITENLFVDTAKFDAEFRLSESKKDEYIQIFMNEGYAKEDCKTIVKVMDAIYHTFDITENRAFEVTKYAANNRLTLTQAVKDKLNVDFREMGEFVDTVLPKLLDYFVSKTVKYGKELLEIIKDVLDSVE